MVKRLDPMDVKYYLYDKVHEWHKLHNSPGKFPDLATAEQAFKDWLWGTNAPKGE